MLVLMTLLNIIKTDLNYKAKRKELRFSLDSNAFSYVEPVKVMDIMLATRVLLPHSAARSLLVLLKFPEVKHLLIAFNAFPEGSKKVLALSTMPLTRSRLLVNLLLIATHR